MSYWLRRLLILSMVVALLALLVAAGGSADPAAVRALFIISLTISLIGGLAATFHDRWGPGSARQRHQTPRRDATSGEDRP